MIKTFDSILIETVELESWEEFSAELRKQDGRPLSAIYRGHADNAWSLVPQCARLSYERFLKFQRVGLPVRAPSALRGQVSYFKHLATGLPNIDFSGLNDIDVEALARHHGLTTNLLDWTRSPYVAAFFAFVTALDRSNSGRLLAGTLDHDAMFLPERPICIWRLAEHPNLWIDEEFELLASLSQVNLWQKAQQGVFTRLTHPDHISVESYLTSRGELNQLRKYLVPGSEVGKALHDLELMNVTFSTLFPDLRGAALQANVGSMWSVIG